MTLDIDTGYTGGDTVRRELLPMVGLVAALALGAGALLRMGDGAALLDILLAAAGLVGAGVSVAAIVRQHRRRQERLRSRRESSPDA